MEGGVTAMGAITNAMGDVTSLATTLLDFITGNPILVVFLAAGFAPVGFRLWKQAKGAAK